MYDFYNNPPTTKLEIHEYIVTWLKPTSDERIVIENELWESIAGFRRAFCCHIVWLNKETVEYAFHVSDDTTNFDTTNFPNFGRYDSWQSLIEGVVDRYALLWKI